MFFVRGITHFKNRVHHMRGRAWQKFAMRSSNWHAGISNLCMTEQEAQRVAESGRPPGLYTFLKGW